MDRPRQTLKRIALALALLVVSTMLARHIVPYRPRAELKLPVHSQILGFSPDGQTLYTAAVGYWLPSSNTGPICAWDLQTARERFRVASDWQIMQVAFSADGRYLGANQHEGGLKIWDARTGKEIDSLPALPHLAQFCFSPDGELLLLQDYRGDECWGVRLWHIRDRREVGRIDEALLGQVRISPDGQRLAEWDMTEGQARVRLWQLSQHRPPTLLAEHLWCSYYLAVSPDLSCVATWTNSEDSCAVTLWDIHHRTVLDTLVVKGQVTFFHWGGFSDRGDHLFITEVPPWPYGTRRFFKITPRLRKVAEFPTHAALSPDGKLVVVPAPNGAELLLADGSTKLGDFVHPGDRVFPSFWKGVPASPTVAFSPDSRLVIVGGLSNFDDDHFLPDWIQALLPEKAVTQATRLWDTQTFREILALDCCEARFAPDGKTMVTHHADDIVQLWDYPLRQPLLLSAFCSVVLWLFLALSIAFIRNLHHPQPTGRTGWIVPGKR